MTPVTRGGGGGDCGNHCWQQPHAVHGTVVSACISGLHSVQPSTRAVRHSDHLCQKQSMVCHTFAPVLWCVYLMWAGA